MGQSIQLQLETCNICNAECVFCPYPAMKRKKGTMSMELFTRLMDEAAILPLIDHITFTGLGETLLDKYLFERIRYARSLMPAVMLDIYSNGTFLTKEKIDALIDAGLSVLYVSLNAVVAEKRQQIMFPNKPDHDDFAHVCEMLDYAIEAGKGRMKTVVKSVVAKDLMECGESDTFLTRWNGPTDRGGNGYIHLEGNWAGATFPMRVKPTTACARALQQIMVLWDGRVSLCCFDGEGEEILGDLNNETIRDVFNGAKATGIREAHWNGRRASIPLCAGCTAI